MTPVTTVLDDTMEEKPGRGRAGRHMAVMVGWRGGLTTRSHRAPSQVMFADDVSSKTVHEDA
jgi:hypothetical protein